MTPTCSVQPTELQPISRSPLNCRLRWRPAAASVSSTCSPPGTPSHWPKLAEIRPSVSSTLICVTPRSSDLRPTMLSAATRACSAAFGWIALTMVLPLTLSKASAQSPAA